jgi:hypothetical protein
MVDNKVPYDRESKNRLVLWLYPVDKNEMHISSDICFLIKIAFVSTHVWSTIKYRMPVEIKKKSCITQAGHKHIL